MTEITIRIDDECNADEFWDHVNGYDVIHTAPISEEARAAVAPLLADGRVREVTVGKDVACELLAWFAELPGWDDGPEHAPSPLIFTPVED